MNRFYVKDGKLIRYFNEVSEVVKFLEIVLFHKTNQNRPQWMQHIRELGYGPDDSSGKVFTESLQDYVEIGIVKENRHVRCNIHEATSFLKPEFGN
jgi:hypothetical protein